MSARSPPFAHAVAIIGSPVNRDPSIAALHGRASLIQAFEWLGGVGNRREPPEVLLLLDADGLALILPCFDGRTGSLLSSLVGSSANDQVGSQVTLLSNGNFVAASPTWNGSNAGPAPINGTFSGLVEGSILIQGGYPFQITYQGGTGAHSVVLTHFT